MGDFNIPLYFKEIDILTDLLSGSITEFERIRAINDALGKRTKEEYIIACNEQKDLFNKLNLYLTNGE